MIKTPFKLNVTIPREILKKVCNFNLQLNDKYRKYSVSSIDSVRVGNEYRKRWNFFYDAYNYFYVIEGIGSNVDLFKLSADINEGEYTRYSEIIKVYYKDKVIWENTELRYKDLCEKK
jgi:hypothetical protein